MNPPPAGPEDAPTLGQRPLGKEELGKALQECQAYLLHVARGVLWGDAASLTTPSEAVHETFLVACRQYGDFRGGTVAEWRAWLSVILRRHVIRLRDRPGLLHASDETLVEVPSRGETPSSVVITRELRSAVDLALTRLSERERAVIQFRNRDHLKFEEIGGRIGTTGEAARKIWARALEQLKAELGPGHAPE